MTWDYSKIRTKRIKILTQHVTHTPTSCKTSLFGEPQTTNQTQRRGSKTGGRRRGGGGCESFWVLGADERRLHRSSSPRASAPPTAPKIPGSHGGCDHTAASVAPSASHLLWRRTTLQLSALQTVTKVLSLPLCEALHRGPPRGPTKAQTWTFCISSNGKTSSQAGTKTKTEP